ncbi:hypothetical protein HPB50_005599 [Hyalomma asiaticum]|uniref:Uncharacterized protein n=1 Tax=Hyalomma asiaticum TaxID=266040 RepID=A0ACB7RHI2_HYAAI|nr:hypothetical protein HPB50_005599 [Hyalomma asiaticum]
MCMLIPKENTNDMCPRNAKGCIDQVESGYCFAKMEHSEESLVDVHRDAVKHGRPDDPNRLGPRVGDMGNCSSSPVQFNATHVNILEGAGFEGASLPVHHPLPATVVPRASEAEQVLNQVGIIHSCDRDGGIITFGTKERAFFSRRSISKILLKSTEKVAAVFKAGDKVCFDAQRNHNPKRQEKWEATMLTTVQRGSCSTVFDDYITAITPAVRSHHIPEMSKKTTATQSKVLGVSEESCVSGRRHFSSQQVKCHAAIENAFEASGPIMAPPSIVSKEPTRNAAEMKEDKKKPPCINGQKNYARGHLTLDQCVGEEFFWRRKLSSSKGRFHAESETMGHVKCYNDGTAALALINIVYCDGKKIEGFYDLPGDDVDVFVDAVEAERDFWIATLVWTGTRPATPQVGRSEDIFSSILSALKNMELQKGDDPTALRRRISTCLRCRSISEYDTLPTFMSNKSAVRTAGWHTSVAQAQELRDHVPAASNNFAASSH